MTRLTGDQHEGVVFAPPDQFVSAPQLRMYRVPTFFLDLEYKLNISLLGVTLVRNFVFLYYSVHWSACVFYFIARQHGLGTDTWIGHDMQLLQRSSPFERCAFCLSEVLGQLRAFRGVISHSCFMLLPCA